MEVLIVLATILILVSAVITVGKTLQRRAAVDLTKSLLEVLDIALQQYYDDHGGFPPTIVTQSDFQKALFGDPPAYTIEFSSGVHDNQNWQSEGLFYFLDHSPNSRKIIGAVSESLITGKDANGTNLKVRVKNSNPVIEFDWPRYIDAWGTSLQYVYPAGAAFPVLTSAGPDRIFGTPDDVTNK